MVCLYYGYDKNFMKNSSEPVIRKWLQTFGIITIILTVIGPLKTLFIQIKAVFKIQ